MDSTIFGHGDYGRLTTTVNGTWLSRAELQPAPGAKRFGIAGEFLPTSFTLTNSLPRNRANFSIFYDGPADTWLGGLDVGAVVHWIGQYEDDNASITGNKQQTREQSRPAPPSPSLALVRFLPLARTVRLRAKCGVDHARPDPELYV